MRTQTDLLAIAGRYANERKVPASTIMKEILHYEILFAMVQSGAAANLVFQGGTALRLCYQGTRYSEDLDFAGGSNFDPDSMANFTDILQREIGDAYGLAVEIKPPKKKDADDGISVERWSAKVHVPAVRGEPQKQVINIEIASVPAHDADIVPIAANYSHLPAPHRQMVIVAESQEEILADKLVALGARDYIKARDIWDIKFLSDRQIKLNMPLVGQKLKDYGWAENDFKAKLTGRLVELDSTETATKFRQEMSRFLDKNAASLIAQDGLLGKIFARAKDLGQDVVDAELNPRPQMRIRA